MINPRSECYRGPAPFSEPETQAVRDLVLKHNFTYAIDFHSGTELILYPWGNTTTPPPDEAKFIEISKDLSNITQGTPYKQSSYLYFTRGCCKDWLYETAGVFAFTIEIFGNETFDHSELGLEPNTVWMGGFRYWFNPFPEKIENVVLRWLPVFFYIAERAVSESVEMSDVTVTAVVHSKTVVGQNCSLFINVTVFKQGSSLEGFNIAVYANTTVIETKKVSLNNGSSITVTFTWNTKGFAKGNYTITAYAHPVHGEIDTANNNSTCGWVIVAIQGDITGPQGFPDKKG